MMPIVQRYHGVIRWHWGSWVFEIYHPVLKRRIWFGTYKREEDVVWTYDEASRLVGRPGVCTNFPLSGRGNSLSMTLRAKLEKFCISSPVQGKAKAARTRDNVQQEEEDKAAITGDNVRRDEESKAARTEGNIGQDEEAKSGSANTGKNEEEYIQEMISELTHIGSMEIIHFSAYSSLVI